MECLKNKRILVTGSCGTVGAELIRQLLAYNGHGPAEIIGVDNNESAIFYQEQQYLHDKRANFFLVDVRDRSQLVYRCKDVDVILHLAAFKHVSLCEHSPVEAVQTNIVGVQNIIYAAEVNNVERVVFTSSDKAVNPTSVMGATKLTGERCITAANSNKRGKLPIFSSIRFGNILGSNGSVMSVFHKQIEHGGPVTLTDAGMSRFIMSVKESIRLIIESVALACGGEIFITKMPVIRIKDLAEVMIAVLAPVLGYQAEKICIAEIGCKPGEKLYEELMNEEETRRSIELEKYFAITPAFKGLHHEINYEYENMVAGKVSQAYNSEHQAPMTKPELKQWLAVNNLLPRVLSEQGVAEQFWLNDAKIQAVAASN